MKSIYSLTRFFAKTSICFTFYQDLNKLVDKQLLTIDDINAPVKFYTVTDEGKQLLQNNYDTNSIRDYVTDIEPTGFILGILYKIDARA